MPKQKQWGFTLIELMVAVAIVAILANIAIPSYQEHIRKSRRSDAKADLLELAQFMERNFTVTNTYVGTVLPFTQSPRTGTAFYNISFQGGAPTQTAFTLQAAPVVGASQANDPCGTLSLTQTGIKGITGTIPVNQCW